MKLRNKQYKLSRGLAFYSELEALRFKEEEQKGWELTKINPFGYYVFQPCSKQSHEWVIDFYHGKKAEFADYLDLYTSAGWELVVDYRGRYCVFKSKEGTLPVYTDELSYRERLKQENKWLLVQSFIWFIIGLIAMATLKWTEVGEWLKEPIWLGSILELLVFILLLSPVVVFILLLYFKVVYLKRTECYNHPDRFAKAQRFTRDMIVSGIIGGIMGGVIGFFSSMMS